MKRIISILAVYSFIGLAASCDSHASCGSNKKPKPEDVNTVYICTGINAIAYHSTDQCTSLLNCSGEIKQVGREMASTTREPCGQCFDKTGIKSTSNKENGETRVKKYVYLDRQNVLHYTLDCDVLQPIEENHTEEYAISFIEIDNLDLPPHWYCSQCFTNRRYEEISKRVPNLPDTLIYSE